MSSPSRITAVLPVVIGVAACAVAPADGTNASQAGRLATADGRNAAAPLAVGGGHTCALGRRGVQCWGRNVEGQISVPTLHNPRQIVAGGYHTCALDDDGVTCWGLHDDGQTTVPALRNPHQLTAGARHTCALDDDGVTCWGYDLNGQASVPPLHNPRQVTAGSQHTCALDDDGVTCWGAIGSSQTMVPPLRNPRQITAGDFHTCAIDDGGATCWGRNYEGQTTVPTLHNPREIVAGGYHTCAIDDGGVGCWGYNAYRETTVPPLRAPSQVGAGSYHTCALDEDEVKCWGANQYGQTAVPPDFELVGRHACVLAGGAVRCVGDNERGQLGLGDDADRLVAFSAVTPIDLGRGFDSPADLAIGRTFACVLGRSGAVKCWGQNENGQLGLGDTRDRGVAPADMGDALPELAFDGGGPMIKLGAGESHACALNDHGELFCWGNGSSGQLGTESTADVGTASGPVRTRLPARLAFRALALGRAHTCAATVDGGVYCFGANDAGQLGLGRVGSIGDRPGTMGDAMEPVNLGDGFKTKTLASGDRHVCALSEDGRVKCWGAGGEGELGLGDARDRGASPDDLGAALPAVDLGHGQIVVAIGCGARHCCAKTVQNTMKCWGANDDGQLGLGDLTARGRDPSSMGDALPFVMTPPHERVMDVQLDADRTCARTDSGLRCWGRNHDAELGYGDREPRGGSLATVPRLLSPLGI
jgi:alpha-tubulin suppressor-like RCC1 family protein